MLYPFTYLLSVSTSEMETPWVLVLVTTCWFVTAWKYLVVLKYKVSLRGNVSGPKQEISVYKNRIDMLDLILDKLGLLDTVLALNPKSFTFSNIKWYYNVYVYIHVCLLYISSFLYSKFPCRKWIERFFNIKTRCVTFPYTS